MHLLLCFQFRRFFRFLLKGGLHLSLIGIYYFVIIVFYSLYCIDLVLSFSKIPSFLKLESRHKIYYRFCELSFLSLVDPIQVGLELTGSVLVGLTG
jgi:hypothetical protein